MPERENGAVECTQYIQDDRGAERRKVWRDLQNVDATDSKLTGKAK